MDNYAGKRAVGRKVVSRKGIPHVFRNATNSKDQRGQLCSRLNCSSRIHSSIVAENGSSRKGKSLRPSIQSSLSSKEAVGSSCGTFSGTSNPRKSLKEPRKTLSSRFETDSSETSSIKDEPEVSVCILPSATLQSQLQPAVGYAESDNEMQMKSAGTSGVLSTRSRRNFHQPGSHGQETKSIGPVTRAGTSRYGLRNVRCNSITDVSPAVGYAESDNEMQMKPAGTSGVLSTRSRRNFHQPGSHGQETKSIGPVTRAGTSRYGLRNVRCNSITDVSPAGCSSSDSTMNKRKGMMKKRNCEGEISSTAKGKKMGGSLLAGQNSGSRSGISISDSRRSRNIPPHRDNDIASVRTQRSISGNARERLLSHGNEYPVWPNESPVMMPPLHDELVLSHHTSAESPSIRLSSHSRLGSSNEQPTSPAEYDISRLLANQNRRQYRDSIAEDIRLVETNFLLGGLNFYDQHRDLRMDIDNMSYEELLALEERMGTVSTALTEEALSQCLKRSIFHSAPSDEDDESCNEINDDIKCSICQDEYVVGDEVGCLQCEHRYHVACIQHWLRLKNWCPVCKASAAPSNSCIAFDQA